MTVANQSSGAMSNILRLQRVCWKQKWSTKAVKMQRRPRRMEGAVTRLTIILQIAKHRALKAWGGREANEVGLQAQSGGV